MHATSECLQSRLKAFPTRLSRSLLPRVPLIPLPYPILRRMSRPRGAALRLAPGRSGGAAAPRWARVHTPVRRGRWQVALGSARGHARAVLAQKCRLFFPDSTGFCGGQKRYHAKSLEIKSGNVLPQRHHKICGQAKSFIFNARLYQPQNPLASGIPYMLFKKIINRHPPSRYGRLSIGDLSPTKDNRVLRIARLVGLNYVLAQ